MKRTISELARAISNKTKLDGVVAEEKNRIRDSVFNNCQDEISDAIEGVNYYEWKKVGEKTNPQEDGRYMVFVVGIGIASAEFEKIENVKPNPWRWKIIRVFDSTLTASNMVTHWTNILNEPVLEPDIVAMVKAFDVFNGKYPGVKISVDQFAQIWKGSVGERKF